MAGEGEPPPKGVNVVWEKAENRQWEMVGEEEERIPGRSRPEGAVDPNRSLQGFLDNFQEEQAAEEGSSRIHYSSGGNMLARISNPPELEEHQEIEFAAPADDLPRRIKNRRRREEQKKRRRGPSQPSHESSNTAGETAPGSNDEPPSSTSMEPQSSTSDEPHPSTSGQPQPSTSQDVAMEPSICRPVSKRRWKHKLWWKRRKEWKRKRKESVTEGEPGLVSRSVESSPGRDSPSPGSLRRIMELHSSYPVLESPEYVAPSPEGWHSS